MENKNIPVLDETNYNEILTKISVEDAEDRFDYSSVVMHLSFDEDSEVEDPSFYFYEGDLHVSSLTMGNTTGIAKFNLIVDGNLNVDGDINLHSKKDMGFVIVNGDVTAKNVIMSGCVEMPITGSLTAENLVFGYDGDNGTLGVDEAINARIVINTNNFTMYFYDEINSVVLGDPIYTNDEVDYEEDQAAKVLLPEFVNKEGKPNAVAIVKAIKEDREIVVEGTATTHEYSDENLASQKTSATMTKDLIQKSQALTDKGKDKEAYEILKTNIASVKLDRKDYDSLYYYYSFLFRIGTYGDYFDKKGEIPYMKEYIKYAHILLDEVNNGMDLFYYSEISKFQRECRKIANNGIAWYLMELGELDEALEYAEKAISLIESDADDYLLDMIVRVRVKREEFDEAYRIVKRTLDKKPKYRFFQGYVNDSDYLAWKEANFKDENKKVTTIEEVVDKFNNFLIGLDQDCTLDSCCSPTFEFKNVATEEQIEKMKEVYEISMPKDLEEFYRKLGCLARRSAYSAYEDHDIVIFSAESMLNGINEEDSTCASFGLIDSIVSHWGDRYEFTDDVPEEDAAIHKAANSKYKCIGEYALDWGLEESYYIIFDESGKFGAVRYHQDEYDELMDELEELLEGKKALTFTLKELVEHALNEIKGVIDYN